MSPLRAGFALGALFCACALASCAAPRPRTAAKAAPTAQDQASARRYYLAGVEAYSNDRFETAIGQWHEALLLVPHYLNAEDYIARAEKMLKAIRRAKKRSGSAPAKSFS